MWWWLALKTFSSLLVIFLSVLYIFVFSGVLLGTETLQLDLSAHMIRPNPTANDHTPLLYVGPHTQPYLTIVPAVTFFLAVSPFAYTIHWKCHPKPRILPICPHRHLMCLLLIQSILPHRLNLTIKDA